MQFDYLTQMVAFFVMWEILKKDIIVTKMLFPSCKMTDTKLNLILC
jgi:hypothetical protein